MPTVRNYRELVCWQVSAALRDGLLAVTDRTTVGRDFRFCDQLCAAARSASSNIAEGFRRSDREFVRYLEIAIGSLRETENHLDEALVRDYISAEEHTHYRKLAKRAILAALALKRYLRAADRR